MLKKIIAMLLAVALVLLTACGTPRYDLSAVFAAAETERAEWLADPDNAVLWEKLGLSGSVVSAGDPTAMTIGAQRWLLQPATVNGEAVTLCFCLNEQDRPLLDLRASFGLNALSPEEWDACEDLFTVRVWATLGGELPETYLSGEAEGLTRYAVQLTDPATGKTVTAVAADSELQQQLGYAAGAHILGFCGSHLQHSFKKAAPRIGCDAATDIIILLYMGVHYKPKPYS